ncbi:hypothetical protein N7540_008102 [Penicillium herquei]|nr:hypothetical protein N7540_008102 [Penicillium herquei]
MYGTDTLVPGGRICGALGFLREVSVQLSGPISAQQATTDVQVKEIHEGCVCHRRSITMHIIIPSYSTKTTSKWGKWETKGGAKWSDKSYPAWLGGDLQDKECNDRKKEAYTVIFSGPKVTKENKNKNFVLKELCEAGEWQ